MRRCSACPLDDGTFEVTDHAADSKATFMYSCGAGAARKELSVSFARVESGHFQPGVQIKPFGDDATVGGCDCEDLVKRCADLSAALKARYPEVDADPVCALVQPPIRRPVAPARTRLVVESTAPPCGCPDGDGAAPALACDCKTSPFFLWAQQALCGSAGDCGSKSWWTTRTQALSQVCR